MQLTALIVSAMAASASAATFYVDNKCTFPLYLESKHDSQTSGVVTIPRNSTNAFNTPIPGSNVRSNSVTVSRFSDLSNPLQAVYNTATNGRTYYDLSTIYGDPLRAQGFELLAGGSGGGRSVSCPPRTQGDCPNTYSPSNPSGTNAVFNQLASANLILQFCSSNGNSS